MGVAGDVREDGLTARNFPQAYTCYTQQPVVEILSGGTLVVRTAVPPATLGGAVRAVIRGVNPESVPRTRTMDSGAGGVACEAAIPNGNSGRICDAGVAAGGGGAVWRVVAHGDGESGADRDPAGDWGVAGAGVPDGDGAGVQACRDWRGGGALGCVALRKVLAAIGVR